MVASIDTGVVSVNQSRRTLTTHFREELFEDDVFAINSGEVVMSGGFATSLALALSSNENLRIDIGPSATLELQVDGDDLLNLGAALQL